MEFKSRNTIIVFFIVIELVICFIFFPTWFFLPTSRLGHFLILAAIIATISTFTLLLYFINKNNTDELTDKEPNLDEHTKLNIVINGKNITKYFLWFGFLLYSVFLIIIKEPALSSQFELGGDEGYHILRVLLVEKLVTFGGVLPLWIISIAFYFSIILVVGLIILLKKQKKLRARLKRFFKENKRILIWSSVLLTIAVIAIYSVLFDYLSFKAGSITEAGNIPISFARFGPINPIIGLIPLITFGYSEFWLHMVSLGFGVFSMIYIYRLVRIYRSEYFAIFISMLVPLLPTVYEYEGKYYLATGVLFFTIACMYHFHKALSKPDAIELNKFLLVYITGFLYKRVVLFTLFSLCVYLLLVLVRRYVKDKQINWKEMKLWFGYLVLALIPTILWMLLTSPVVWRKYIFNFDKLISEKILGYANLMPQYISFIAFIAIIGIPLSLIFMRDHLTFSSLVLSVSIYLIYTADDGWPVEVSRFIMPILPFVIICSLQILDFSIEKISNFFIQKKPKLKVKIKKILPIIWLLITIGFLVPLTIEGIETDREQIQEVTPFDKTAKFLAENLTSEDSVVLLFGSHPFAFYAEKYGITCTMYIIKNISSEQSVISYMEETNSSYLVIPYESINRYISEDTYNYMFDSGNFLLFKVLTSDYGKRIIILILIK